MSANIKIIGIGTSRIYTVEKMISHNLKGVRYAVIDTNSEALEKSNAPKKILFGKSAENIQDMKEKAEFIEKSIEEVTEDITGIFKECDMAFIVCGMGGITASTIAHIIAKKAKEMGVLTIAVVSKPFAFEGKRRKERALEGIKKLKDNTDSLIVIDCDKLGIKEVFSFKQTFSVVDEVMMAHIQCISDIIQDCGMINVDFDDIKEIMKDSGLTVAGFGKSSGENGAAKAAELALGSNQCEGSVINAKGIIFNITGGSNMTLMDVNNAAEIIYATKLNSEIIFGAVVDDRFKDDEFMVTIIATGLEDI